MRSLCEALQAFDGAIAARKAAANQEQEQALPDGLKLEDASMLLQPGSKDGAVKVVRENGAGVAYSWSAARCGAQYFAGHHVHKTLVHSQARKIRCGK